MGGVLTFNPNGTVNYTGRQAVPGLITSRDLNGEECSTCGGKGTLPLMNVFGQEVARGNCVHCNGTGVEPE